MSKMPLYVKVPGEGHVTDAQAPGGGFRIMGTVTYGPAGTEGRDVYVTIPRSAIYTLKALLEASRPEINPDPLLAKLTPAQRKKVTTPIKRKR